MSSRINYYVLEYGMAYTSGQCKRGCLSLPLFIVLDWDDLPDVELMQDGSGWNQRIKLMKKNGVETMEAIKRMHLRGQSEWQLKSMLQAFHIEKIETEECNRFTALILLSFQSCDFCPLFYSVFSTYIHFSLYANYLKSNEIYQIIIHTAL